MVYAKIKGFRVVLERIKPESVIRACMDFVF